MISLLRFKITIRTFLFISILCIFPMIIHFLWKSRNADSKFFEECSFSNSLHNVTKLNSDVISYTISTSGCKIPFMSPYNEVVKPFITTQNFTVLQNYCGKLPMLTSMTENNEILLIEKSLEAYGVTSKSHFRCCITEILRDKGGKDNDEYRYSVFNCVDIDLPYHVRQDYIRIQCFRDDTLIYTDFYAAIQIKPDLEETCAKRTNDSRKLDGAKKLQLSLIIFTLDGVSRLNFHRQMKESSAFIIGTMKGVEMLGYNKQADNTFPILVSILAGMSEKEVQASCGGPYDNCPLLWKKFSSHGYCTAYGEDSYIIASFNSLRKGFRQQPTDYYLRPLFSAEYASVPRTDWNPHDYHCFANRVQVPVLFNWTRDFILNMKERPHFGYFHTSGLTHDDLNWAQFVDPMLLDLLYRAFHSGAFNHTIFILMSDHGMRFGPIRKTYFGKLEESLPLLIFTFPEWFRQANPSVIRRLKVNSLRLMSSFDIHETLLEILGGNYSLRMEVYSPGRVPRGISLFQEIPEWRSCTDAHVPDHWCACQTVQQGDVDAPEAIAAANVVVHTINSFTEARRNVCAEFLLKSLNKVDISKPTSENCGYKRETKDYTVGLKTTPGDAEFEGTVRFVDNKIVDVLTDVSRVNRYNNESHCITDSPALKKYCYCLNNK